MPPYDEQPRSRSVHPRPARRETPADRAGPPVRIRELAELIATVPALIGYHPGESFVLIGTGGRSGHRIGVVLRADLPPPAHLDLVVADAVDSLLRDEPVGAVVIVLGARPVDTEELPHPELAGALYTALTEVGVEPHTVAWAESTATGAPWACYLPCGCSGVLPDPAGTVAAASVVAAGQIIHPDRAALERLVAPADPDRVARRERLLISRHEAALDRPDGTAEPAAGLAVLDAAIAAAESGSLELAGDDRTAVELGWALSDIRVRDAALLRCLGPAAAAAERLWLALARELPDPEAAEPAVLLAVAAFLRGDGALANVALERAGRAWPGHRLTRLVRCALDAGLHPAQLREWLAADPTGAPDAPTVMGIPR